MEEKGGQLQCLVDTVAMAYMVALNRITRLAFGLAAFFRCEVDCSSSAALFDVDLRLISRCRRRRCCRVFLSVSFFEVEENKVRAAKRGLARDDLDLEINKK